MKFIVYSNYGHMQGIIKNENNVFLHVSIKTTNIGQDPIARFNSKQEALEFTDSHYNQVARVKFAGLLRDCEGNLD